MQVTPDPLEDPAIVISCDDWIITNSYDGGMAGGSTLVVASPEQRISTFWTLCLIGGCSTSGLATSPPGPSSSDQEGKPCAPPPGEAGTQFPSSLPPQLLGEGSQGSPPTQPLPSPWGSLSSPLLPLPSYSRSAGRTQPPQGKVTPLPSAFPTARRNSL